MCVCVCVCAHMRGFSYGCNSHHSTLNAVITLALRQKQLHTHLVDLQILHLVLHKVQSALAHNYRLEGRQTLHHLYSVCVYSNRGELIITALGYASLIQ